MTKLCDNKLCDDKTLRWQNFAMAKLCDDKTVRQLHYLKKPDYNFAIRSFFSSCRQREPPAGLLALFMPVYQLNYNCYCSIQRTENCPPEPPPPVFGADEFPKLRVEITLLATPSAAM
jgi:hypothetical protein